ncbi:MAG: CvpA family protein [Thermomicrobiales bacterium]
MGPALVDGTIILFVALLALCGVRVGFLRAVASLVFTLIVVAIMLLGYEPVRALIARLSGLGDRGATIVAFIILGVCGQAIVFALQWPINTVIAAARRPRAMRVLDTVAGALPGAAVACLAIGLLLAPIAIALPDSNLGPAMRSSRLAPPLLDVDARLMQTTRVRPLLEPAAAALSFSWPLTTHEEGRELPYKVAASDLTVRPDLEARMLTMVNQERARAGQPALAWDDALLPIARAHGEEMFELGYFSHDSPVSGSPFDRLNAAGIQYHAAGENLALAPDLDIAMQGLMNSPGHRANILSPDYGRVGIGIISSRYHGLMVVQLCRS